MDTHDVSSKEALGAVQEWKIGSVGLETTPHSGAATDQKSKGVWSDSLHEEALAEAAASVMVAGRGKLEERSLADVH